MVPPSQAALADARARRRVHRARGVEAMVELSMQQGDLVVVVRGWSRLWAFKKQLRVPLSQIRTVRWDTAVASGWWKSWRMLGTHIPGVIIAGTFFRGGRREFWDVRDGSKAVT